MSVRIAKFIADSGMASRRGAESMIADGRIAVNGNVINSPVFFINPDTDIVTIDDKKIKTRTSSKLFMFHKPINTMTTANDPRGRRTVYDCLSPEYRGLKYVGRLDYKTTGLLLLTDDGMLARKLTLPSSHVPRTYVATVNSLDTERLNMARRGITVDGVHYRPMHIDIIDDNNLRVTVDEGKKNEVRIVLRACGAPVRKLHRISFGNIMLGNLKVGQIKQVSQKTIDVLLKSL